MWPRAWSKSSGLALELALANRHLGRHIPPRQTALNILVTGGTGFIGQLLVPRLLSDGAQVTVLTRSSAKAAKHLPPSVVAVESLADVTDDMQIDAVINLAGESLAGGRWNAKRKQAFHDSRVGLTEQLVEWMAAREQRPKVLVSGSAVGWYGAQGQVPLDESALPVKEYQHTLCRDWEQAATGAVPLGVRVCCLRIGVVLGTDGGALDAMITPFKLGLGGWLGDGEQIMSWIHRHDLVQLICAALADDTLRGPVNATAPQPVSNKHFSKALGHALGRPVFMPMPATALRLLVGEMAHLLLTGQYVLPKKALDHGFEFAYPTVESAFEDILRRSR